MALPKLVTPEFETVIPSTKERIRFRPFLVKEEKILYMALESGQQRDIFNATKSILENCILTPGIEFDKLTSYDMEYLFLKLRSKSVGENISLNLRHTNDDDCKHLTEVHIDVDQIDVQFDDNHEYKIDIGNGIGIKLSDPNASIFMKYQQNENEIENMLNIMYECVEMVYDENDVYDEFTNEEFQEFVGQLTKEQFEPIVDFFNTLPKLKHDVEYTCSQCGKNEKITLEGLQSFFT